MPKRPKASDLTGKIRTTRETFAALCLLFAAVVAILLGAALFAQHLMLTNHNTSQRHDLLLEVGDVRASLEAKLQTDVALIDGLAELIQHDPNAFENRFSDQAIALIRNHDELVNVALAPDLIVQAVYPLEGNQSVLGVNYHNIPNQRDTVYRARDTRQLQIAGPVNLIQGGLGIIVRVPVFLNEGTTQEQFWGIISGVISADKLFAHAKLDQQDNFDIHMIGRDGLGAQGEAFFGDPAILEQDPIFVDVNLPNGTWQLAAIPAGGWQTFPADMVKFWLFEFVILCLILVPLMIMSGLYNDRLRQRSALRGVMRRLDLALSASEIGVWEYNISSNELFWDDRMRKFYEVGLSQPIAVLDWVRKIHPEDVKRATRDFELSVETDKPYRSSFRLMTKDGDRHIRTIGSKFIDDKGDTKIVGVNWDVTEEEARNFDLQKASQLAQKRNDELLEANEKIEQIALHDALTQLPNRRYLDEFLTKLSKDNIARFGFIHLDLDRFKHVNDTMGHAAGDALLAGVAERLRQNMEPQDFVARIGGDEFVMVCLSAQNQLALNTRAKNIVASLQEPIDVGENKVLSTASLGIALSNSAHGDPHQLMVNADIALYRAKKAGRNCYKYYSAEMHGQIVDNKKLSDDLFRALERGEFEAYVQPQFCAATHKITGAEVLARWNHPSRGVLTPFHFLEASQDLNILPQIDALMLDQALDYMKLWRHLNLAPDHISVNVSAKRLADPALVDGLMKRPFKRGELTFELVESTFLDSHDEVVAHNLDRIRDLGIGIEIDDFGTGYASIVSLIKLHPHALKLDRQLTNTVGPNPKSHQLVRSIVDIARNLKIEVVAEGVETLEQAEILTLLGVDTFQGFAFARPMPAAEFEQFAIEWNARLVAA